MGRFFIIISLLTMIGCKQRNQAVIGKHILKDTTLKMLIFGMPDLGKERALNTAAQKYGFRYYWVGGCVISHSLWDSINKENEITQRKIEAKFGVNWYKKFAMQFDTIYHRQQADTYPKEVEAIPKL
jgi:hypothetical protein